VRQATERLAALAARRQVEVATEGPAARAHGDPEQLGHALRNLVDNAVKFSPPGARVTARTFASDGEVGITVEDEGQGIPESLHQRVFDRFLRVDGSRTRGTGGSGLGLAIAREIVEAHGGRIAVAPRPESGSAFTIALAARD
jgi:two-component system sensor histidine kinase SenX3